VNELAELRTQLYRLTKAVAEHMNDPLGHIYRSEPAPGDLVSRLVSDVERSRFQRDGIEAPE
jgi:hypothetical protein